MSVFYSRHLMMMISKIPTILKRWRPKKQVGDLFETPYIYHPHLGGESGYGGGQYDVERYRINADVFQYKTHNIQTLQLSGQI